MTLQQFSTLAGLFVPTAPDKSPVELGELLKGYITRSGKTQRKLAEEAGIPNPSYLSHMANGRINWVESDYFRKLATALDLSVAEIQALNPDIVISTVSEEAEPISYSAGARGWKVPKQAPEPIPDSLLEAAKLYGENAEFAGIREYRWQRWMTDSPHKHRPSTPEEWLSFYMSVKDRFNPKEPKE